MPPEKRRRNRADDRPSTQTTDQPRGSDRLAAGLLAVAITVVFFDMVIGAGVLYTRDVVLYHVPLKTILRAIVMDGEFPYWNPFITGGQPLAANPAHEVFYPLTWLILLPGSLVHGVNWQALIHLYLGTIGTYALIRSLDMTRFAAVIGALSFGLGGFVLSSLSLLPFVFSAAWLPLTCLFARRFLHHHAPRDFALAAGSLAMQFLVGEPVTVAQTGLLLGLYALFRKSRLRDLGFVAAISLTALLLSSVQTLPGLDHARDSVRADGFDFKSVSEWSTPPRRLIEVFFPDVYGTARPDELYAGGDLYPGRRVPFILSIYSGLLIATLAAAGAITRVRGVWLYLSIAALSIILALGRYTPLLQFLYDLGVVRSIRYPEKFLMMGMFASVIFGARVLDELLRGNPRVRMAAMALAAATALIGAIQYTQTDFWRGVLLLALLAVTPKISRAVAVAFLAAFVLVDLAPRAAELAPRKAASLYTTEPPALRQLAPNRDDYRILHVDNWSQRGAYRRGYRLAGPNLYVMERNALSGYIAAAYGVRTAAEIDYDLTGLRTSDEFTRAAVALHKGSPSGVDYVSAMSNVRYVAYYHPPARAYAAARGDAERVNPIYFVERPAHPRYYFASAVATARDRTEFVSKLAAGGHDPRTAFIAGAPFQPAAGRVLHAADSATHARIDVEAAGKAFLVMSVTAHKYWSVTIDGREVPSVLTNLGYQGVAVPSGRHVVEMRYRNPLIAIGGAISIATLLALLFAALRRHTRITPAPTS